MSVEAAAVAPSSRSHQPAQVAAAAKEPAAAAPLRVRIDESQKALNELFKELAALNARSKELNQSTPAYNARREEIINQQDVLAKQVAALEAQRVQLLAQTAKAAAAAGPGGGGGGGKGFTVEELDARIRQLERDQMARRLLATEEMRIIKQISQLKQNRAKLVADARDAAQRAADAKAAAVPLREQLEAIRAELTACQRKKRDLDESMSALQRRRREVTAPLRELAEQREDLQTRILELRGKLNRDRDELTAVLRQWELQQAQQRQKRLELKLQQAKLDDMQRRRSKLELQLEDLEGELQTVEFLRTQRLANYVRSLAAKLEDTTAVAAVEEAETPESPPAELEGGYRLMVSSKAAERLASGVPSSSSSAKKHKRKTSKLHAAAAANANAPLIHDVQSLADFQRLGLEPPFTLSDCGPLKTELEARLEKLAAQQTEGAEKLTAQRKKLLAELAALDSQITALQARRSSNKTMSEENTPTKATDDDDEPLAV